MEICIGTQIRDLRKKSHLTQEQLAERIGISFQAVSKWENQLALPDVTLVPKLAQIFGVTTDEIFGYNLHEMQEDITQYVARAAKVRENAPVEARRILEEGLKQYPGNDILLNNLLYTMDVQACPDEVIRIADKLIENSDQIDVKYDALRFMAYGYHAKGEEILAVKAIEQLPEIYFSKLEELTKVSSGTVKLEAAEKQKWLSFESLIQMMGKMSECCEAEGDKISAAREIETILLIMDAFSCEEKITRFDDQRECFERRLARLRE